jgi:tetratricopeptide (TPR) repeat protein
MTKSVYISLFILFFAACVGNKDARLTSLYDRGSELLDSGDAVAALECFQEAAYEADTSASDCDFITLMNIYGSMSRIYDAQELKEDCRTALSMASRLGMKGGDTLSALYYAMDEAQTYSELQQYDKALELAKQTRRKFIDMGHTNYADYSNGTIGVIHLARGEYREAKLCLDRYYNGIIRNDSSELRGDSASYWIFMAIYFEGVDKPDSAVACFHKALSSTDKSEKTMVDGYSGLAMLYKARQEIDSAYKYQNLYIDAIDVYTEKMKDAKVLQMASLYNYKTHKRNAEKASVDAMNYKFLVFVMIIVAVVVIGILLFIRITMRHRMLRISKEKTAAEAALKLINIGKDHKELRSTDIFLRLTEYVKNPVKSDDIREEEWIYLQNTMENIYPTIHAVLHRAVSLSDKGYRVCLLTKAGFKPSDITLLLNLSSGEVSHIKVRLLKKIFSVEGKTSDFNSKIAQL